MSTFDLLFLSRCTDQRRCPRNANANRRICNSTCQKSKNAIDLLIKTFGYLSRLLFFSRLNVIDWMSRHEMGWYLILCRALNLLLVFLVMPFIISYIRYFSFTYSHLRLPCRSKTFYFDVLREIHNWKTPSARFLVLIKAHFNLFLERCEIKRYYELSNTSIK